MPRRIKAGALTGAVLLVRVLVNIGVLIGAVVIDNLQLEVLLRKAAMLILEVHLLEIQTLM